MASLNVNKLQFIVSSCLGQDITNYNVFIETGTLIADTVINLRSQFNSLYSIELSPYYYNYSKERLLKEGIDNVDLKFGDSVKVLPELIKTISSEGIIFFLDGHWSSGDTAKGEKDCPLIEECYAIDNLCKQSNVILLIDDYRLFETNINEDWSQISLKSIEDCFKNYKIVSQTVYDDVLGLYLIKDDK